ncbi:SDR family oxidoreductase [Rhodospirillum rubrum]|uniref:Short-chain dehydrogenase/reductase SDR n=1 Tax=Rhodospirillum rubrum (strain ATCC 11170 / ATH 1.1.1 / DSM 467 / LMG 4362 / NCIMB 8255 / S1) TaxID=269796 RepID=Q2RUT8_RHORT|nr:NAD(P)-dependent oxidoreductase [Rhodospirillum rubrum]ABC22107.1 Short-chain dehydrogenase/reductase SDR [Rhodospirillum rubrum ATCC 11170]AEO47821.1 short chain dehydrogenase [Rhodospirillum rubrum F11]MBK5953696.1 short chain dehydrogenase [Rhodospirillum rubrum]QXG81757.1 NAD(P)-dependent oxidoreductase [Rhodospirillum rubrum]
MTDPSPSLAGKTLFISGASRGIGKAIALRAAQDGANIAIIAKTSDPNPKLPGTIHSAATEIEAAGGKALALAVDIRDEAAIADAVARTLETFGGIDIVINNASAISLSTTAETPMKRFDLMVGINTRGTFAVTQACLPALRKAANPHILTLSPPPSLDPRWFGPHVAYTISKMGMSLCVLGWAEEFREAGIAANALWPRTVIDTAALRMLGGAVKPEFCRKPEIVADAAHAILTRDARACTGHFFLDDEVLAEEGITDLTAYAVSPGHPLLPDLFLE